MASQRYKLKTHLLLAIAAAYSLLGWAIWRLHGMLDGKQLWDESLLWGAWFCSGMLLTVWQYRALAALQREIAAINLHADCLRDNAFNLSANTAQLSELIPVAESLNAMSVHFQQERANLYQRELLLDTVLQTSPSALILTDAQDRVLLANPSARQLLHQHKRFEGSILRSVLCHLPEVLTAIDQQQSLIIFEVSASIWHLSVSHFQLNQHSYCLYQFKPVTKEIHQEEMKAWRKLLKVIGHELNNSLAPMSSLTYSGRQLAEQQGLPAFANIFLTISERCQHLNQFLQEYINFAKLPVPQRQVIHWPQLINGLQDHYEFELLGNLPERTWLFDQAQLEQLLLNLLKNAYEAGATAEGIQLTISERIEGLLMELQDDAGGMTEETLLHALVPFFTTKENGSGIGLTLCQEIVQAHSGNLTLKNRGAGLLVTILI